MPRSLSTTKNWARWVSACCQMYLLPGAGGEIRRLCHARITYNAAGHYLNAKEMLAETGDSAQNLELLYCSAQRFVTKIPGGA
ncbi:uncharacterized protein M421DRAFT_418940 [Didymella exigua CBS 183.55]|uniref:Uncharacterized protein n=1 Tax=Didymella exigua CBS 183.55 TaxID=1150837 RepID=A0A6A5RQM7_9PLEO|nr:uncharacterized protein M421DRAFT_418940 [Didymella exigua CBS 183.55]KAF1930645.1 hypothetical protein M421DRAFT_418940 [Didymella exigua CBS 183.55]